MRRQGRRKGVPHVLVGSVLLAVALTACEVPRPQTGDFLDSSKPALPYWSLPHGTGQNEATVVCNHRDPGGSADVSLRLQVFGPGTSILDAPDTVEEVAAEAERTGVPDDDLRNTSPTVYQRPAIVYFHSGGWNSGDETDDEESIYRLPGGFAPFKALLDEGWVVVSAQYRLSGEADFPAQIIDAKAAVNCVKRFPGVNENHVMVAGASAGGHLATLVAVADVPEWEPLAPSVADTPAPMDFIGAPVDPIESPDLPPPGRTTVVGAFNIDGPTDLELMHTSSVDRDISSTAAMIHELFCPPDTPGSAEYVTCENLLDQPVTYDGRTKTRIQWASPIDHVADLDSPRLLYLACGDSTGDDPGNPVFPVNFERCTDHNAFYDEISDELGTAGTDVTWIDRTYLQLTDPGQPPGSNNPVHEVNSNHLTIVNFLNQSAIVKLAKSPH